MAKKKTSVKDITDELQNGSEYLYDEWIVPNKIRMVIDIENFIQDSELYQRQLMLSRGIPQQPSSFQTNDPNIKIAMDYYKHIKDKKKMESSVVSAVEQHYERLIEKMHALGGMLAATKYSVIEKTPEPYDDDDEGSFLPGVVNLPEPIPDLDNPVEYRLKQILDVLIEHPEGFRRFQEIFRTARVKIASYNANGGKVAPGESS